MPVSSHDGFAVSRRIAPNGSGGASAAPTYKEIERVGRIAVADPETGLQENYRHYEGFSVYDAQKCRIE